MDKARENTTALEVLPDLLRELDALEPHARLTALVEGVLAANIFDWGARECVEMYRDGTILEIYRWVCRCLRCLRLECQSSCLLIVAVRHMCASAACKRYSVALTRVMGAHQHGGHRWISSPPI